MEVKTIPGLRVMFLSNYYPFDPVPESDPWHATAADDAYLARTLAATFEDLGCGSCIDDFLAVSDRTDLLISRLFPRNDETAWSTARAVAEVLNVPALGAPSNLTTAFLDKCFQKNAFACHGIPTSRWSCVLQDGSLSPGFNLAFPCIVKWRDGHNSKYIDGRSVVRNSRELKDAIARLHLRGLRVLVEEFVPGTDLTVGAIGPESCEIGKVVRIDSDNELNMQTFPMKHHLQRDRRKTIFTETNAVAEIEGYVRRIFGIFRPFDFMRVDFRYDSTKQSVFAIECNISSNYDAHGSFHMSFAGSYPSYRGLVVRLVQACMHRHGLRPCDEEGEWRTADWLAGGATDDSTSGGMKKV